MILKTEVQLRQELATCWQLIEQDKAGIESLRHQCAAQLSELEAISSALGTSEGHSSVTNILDLRKNVTLLRDALKLIADEAGETAPLVADRFVDRVQEIALEALAATETTSTPTDT